MTVELSVGAELSTKAFWAQQACTGDVLFG